LDSGVKLDIDKREEVAFLKRMLRKRSSVQGVGFGSTYWNVN